MSGAVALHGGGEFLAGDEPFLAALLESARDRVGGERAIRVVVVPTAAARGRPDLAAANGVAAFDGVARSHGVRSRSRSSTVVDARSASSPAWSPAWPPRMSSTSPVAIRT